MELLIIIFLFIVWTAFGSFGSVLIRRMKSEIDKEVVLSIVCWRSQCPHCNKTLNFLQLIPLFSWLFTRWKCSFCGSKVSSFYFWLELISGIIFVMSYLWIVSIWQAFYVVDFWILFVFMVIVNWILVLFFFFDFLFYRVNTYLWVFLTLWVILWQFFNIVGDFEFAFLGWVWLFVFFYLFYMFGKYYVKYRFGYENSEWIGWWDVMMAFSVWLLVPFVLESFDYMSLLYFIFSYVMLSSILWIMLYLFFSLLNEKQGNAIPFLPAMIVAFWIMLFLGQEIIDLLYIAI